MFAPDRSIFVESKSFKTFGANFCSRKERTVHENSCKKHRIFDFFRNILLQYKPVLRGFIFPTRRYLFLKPSVSESTM